MRLRMQLRVQLLPPAPPFLSLSSSRLFCWPPVRKPPVEKLPLAMRGNKRLLVAHQTAPPRLLRPTQRRRTQTSCRLSALALPPPLP